MENTIKSENQLSASYAEKILKATSYDFSLETTLETRFKIVVAYLDEYASAKYSEQWTKGCECKSEDVYGETWCCNHCGKPTSNKSIERTDGWISVKERAPLCYQSGNYDGKKSEKFIALDKDDEVYVAVAYEGTIDGSYFYNFYDKNDVEILNVTHWKKI